MLKIGITGGMGSGKSTVCRMFASSVVSVYDSDQRAKEMMDSAPALIKQIKKLFGNKAYRDGSLDRAYVASRVFTDKSLLHSLNSIVHPAVGLDFEKWSFWMENDGDEMIVLESAILFESGFDKYVDYVVAVSAPIEMRVARSVARDGSDPRKVRERMANQMTDSEREARADFVIMNDGDLNGLREQVVALYKQLNDVGRK